MRKLAFPDSRASPIEEVSENRELSREEDCLLIHVARDEFVRKWMAPTRSTVEDKQAHIQRRMPVLFRDVEGTIWPPFALLSNRLSTRGYSSRRFGGGSPEYPCGKYIFGNQAIVKIGLQTVQADNNGCEEQAPFEKGEGRYQRGTVLFETARSPMNPEP